ncbi:response regulator [Paludisphaera mucosa]|uniref:Response regulator n=1 Tax=Paludisphaera mucosa TaxID=3030827 RepID=A0ABT6FEB8_9BACT|nr:response regulator [Paludisphaera mucosa]MDG3005930.1 response regulator [Paludisphaera mucosa]
MARVLVVEDSPTQAAEIRFLLEDAGVDVDLAGDGYAALASLQEGLPDLVVTDLQMPRMDGLALVEAVRGRYPIVPVVLITAHGSEEVAARALRCGAASYVPKRDLARDLARVVHQVVSMAAPAPGQERISDSLDEARSRFTLPNDESLVAPLVRRLEGAVFEMGLCGRAELIRLAVALREAIVNAIDHGNLELDSELRQDDERVYHSLGRERREQSPYRERRVRIDVGLTRSEATFTIRDEGPGFDPSTLPDPSDPANLCRIGGRGVMLIRTLMDEVRFNEKGNEITLVKHRRAPGQVDEGGPADR